MCFKYFNMRVCILRIIDSEVIVSYQLEITEKGIKESKKCPKDFWTNFHKDVSIIQFIISSELRARVFDKTLGILMLTVEPIVIALLYYLLTVVIFRFDGNQNHFLYIFTAVIFWRWFSRTVDASPSSIISYGSVLKQTNFPIYLVILSYVALECVYMAINFCVLIVFLAFFKVYPSIQLVYLPLIILSQFSLMFWLVLVFSVAGTFIKDLSGILYAFTSVWWYLSPGIYPVSNIPAQYMWIYNLNPFTHILPAYQNVLILHKAPNLMPLLIIFCVSVGFGFLGLKLLNKARYHFFMYL